MHKRVHAHPKRNTPASLHLFTKTQITNRPALQSTSAFIGFSSLFNPLHQFTLFLQPPNHLLLFIRYPRHCLHFILHIRHLERKSLHSSFEVTDSPNVFAAGARCVGMLSLREDFDVFGVAYRVKEWTARI